ncbi:hypothetical protein [Allorhodopirellula solitaria]|nr:hypothetical protein [Allorhodopirellula solitaria]
MARTASYPGVMLGRIAKRSGVAAMVQSIGGAPEENGSAHGGLPGMVALADTQQFGVRIRWGQFAAEQLAILPNDKAAGWKPRGSAKMVRR